GRTARDRYHSSHQHHSALAFGRSDPKMKEMAMDAPSPPVKSSEAPSAFALGASKTASHPTKLEVKNVKFFYANGFEALHGINLVLRDKTVTSFIGPSGCGKS